MPKYERGPIWLARPLALLPGSSARSRAGARAGCKTGERSCRERTLLGSLPLIGAVQRFGPNQGDCRYYDERNRQVSQPVGNEGLMHEGWGPAGACCSCITLSPWVTFAEPAVLK